VTDATEGLLGPLTDIAHRAGQAILAVYVTDFEVERKADRSPLTEADLAAHRCIVDGLGTLTPDIPVLSEESGEIPFTRRRRWPVYWLVDPLDGTREFVKRNGEFTVNIALIQNGRPIIGVVHAPALERTWLGCEGVGAFRIGAGNGRERIRTRPAPEGELKVVASRSHASKEVERLLQGLGEYERVPRGSSLKFCVLAEGGADFYPRLGPTSEWDTAAGQAVLEAAGGAVVDLEGRPLRYNREESLLNPHFLAYGDGGRDWLGLLKSLPARE
jgi:3'(2'), 5'-bisphosphate nucleotidase